MLRGARFPDATLAELAARFGGEARANPAENKRIGRIVPIELAEQGELAPLIHARFLSAAAPALARGASLLLDASLLPKLSIDETTAHRIWVSPRALLTMTLLLESCEIENAPPQIHATAKIGKHVVIHPRVVIGANVIIGDNTVIGAPGFGWAISDSGARAIPQLGGVAIEDDVWVGALCTIDAGTLSPTRIRARTKIDSQVHVGHNTVIGEDCIVAAQCGFAGSVKIGDRVLIGGQSGFGDHVVVGSDARFAGKSGVIGDIPAGAVVAGYPAVPRLTWLRGVAQTSRSARRRRKPE
jgi:UDP-3-O-[3-hydroxymyristoyl] glucosamine N-acyltransferase